MSPNDAMRPGRGCPVEYRYGADALSRPAELHADTLLIAGGLYGNPYALDCLLELHAAERDHAALVFNGDFHWFDVDTTVFARINTEVLAHVALRGNVETELASGDSAAGCGCGYPDWVSDGDVERSNRIIERLRGTARAFPSALPVLAGLPMHCVAQVGAARVAIVHGDADSLAGWGFAQEALASEGGLRQAVRACERAGANVIACSHTCLPVLQCLSGEGEASLHAIANNGAAGMPNFAGTQYGVVTRVSLHPHRDALYGVCVAGVYVEALAVKYDARRWQERFLDDWPAGSDAHASYYRRIVDGPRYTAREALRRAGLEAPVSA